MHRLCPDYATDINSPLRHVRTRIYFTSESHVHSLINVLRFCHLGALPLPVRSPVKGSIDLMGGTLGSNQVAAPVDRHTRFEVTLPALPAVSVLCHQPGLYGQ